MTPAPRLLASVADLEEARLALDLGADILDLKDPRLGALGAWPVEAVREAVLALGGRRPLSATIGDVPMEPLPIHAAAAAMALTGVDIVKVGFFGTAPDRAVACAAALAPLAAAGTRLVAVVMADQRPDLALLPVLAGQGFLGAMLDTADKSRGGLLTHLDLAALGRFVATARAQGLLTGLAGSLGLADIAPLAALAPDYLGFRGALCHGDRTQGLAADRFRIIRAGLAATGAGTDEAAWPLAPAALRPIGPRPAAGRANSVR